MPNIDWNKRDVRFGLAVEGNDDKTIIEAFLSIGDKKGYWAKWDEQIVIEIAGNYDRVIKETAKPDVWGLIDRDWRTDDQVAELQREHPRLLILPRVMIENYLINPDELVALLPSSQLQNGQRDDLKARIEFELDRWVQNGAMWQALHEEDADRFCRDREDDPGYPGALRKQPIIDENAIRRILQEFQAKLDPTTILPAYHTRLKDFRSRSREDHYRQCIYGKNFFSQVVLKALNDVIKLKSKDDGKSSESWVDRLMESPPDCPTDLIPILQKLLS